MVDLPEYKDDDVEEPFANAVKNVSCTVWFADHPVVNDDSLSSSMNDIDDGHDDREEVDPTEQPFPNNINDKTQLETLSACSNEEGKQDLEENIELVTEMNDQVSHPDESQHSGGSRVVGVCVHKWELGQVHFKVQMSNDETS